MTSISRKKNCKFIFLRVLKYLYSKSIQTMERCMLCKWYLLIPELNLCWYLRLEPADPKPVQFQIWKHKIIIKYLQHCTWLLILLSCIFSEMSIAVILCFMPNLLHFLASHIL